MTLFNSLNIFFASLITAFILISAVVTNGFIIMLLVNYLGKPFGLATVDLLWGTVFGLVLVLFGYMVGNILLNNFMKNGIKKR